MRFRTDGMFIATRQRLQKREKSCEHVSSPRLQAATSAQLTTPILNELPQVYLRLLAILEKLNTTPSHPSLHRPTTETSITGTPGGAGRLYYVAACLLTLLFLVSFHPMSRDRSPVSFLAPRPTVNSSSDPIISSSTRSRPRKK